MCAQTPHPICSACYGCGLTYARPGSTGAAAKTKGTTPMKFNVPDMSCSHCVSSITKAIKALDADARVTADLSARTLSIETSATAPAVSRALDEAGYPNTTA